MENFSPEQLQEEKQKLEKLKAELEQKNKQMWTMSETVYKEKKKVDEQLKEMLEEKVQLEEQKKENDAKVKMLWEQSTAIHKEKERINILKLEIEQRHQEVMDSVNYAKRIQNALLATDQFLSDNLPEHFIFFQPKDIVSGDFYWAASLENEQFCLVTADSTGHGVPGAIMSILNISCLSEAIGSKKLLAANEILDYTRDRIIEHMLHDGSAEGGKDGMDAVICNFNFKDNTLQFAAANNPVWIFRGEEIIEFKGDKMPVGKPMGETKPFSLQQTQLQKNDLVITLTDGFPDQFGGERGKKFMYKPLKELIASIKNEPAANIREILKQRFESWKTGNDQIDDVLIIGVRIK